MAGPLDPQIDIDAMDKAAGLSPQDVAKMDAVVAGQAPGATQQQPAAPPAAPGFMARLEGKVRGKDPAEVQAGYRTTTERGLGMPEALKASPAWAIPGAAAGSRLAGPLVQGAIQGAVRGGEALMEGRGLKQAGKEALTSALSGAAFGKAGQLVGKAGGAVASQTSGALFRSGEKRAAEIADQLKQDAPALSKFPSNVRGLKQMLLGQRGFNTMHEAYDASIKKAVAKAGDQTIAIPREVAKEMGFKVEAAVTPAPSGRGFEVPMVDVPAGDAVKRILGKGGTRGYRVVTDALAEKGLVDPEMRKAYATWSGLRDYFSKAGAFSPRGFDLYAAQQAVNKAKGADILNRRQLGPYGEMLGPEITKSTFKGPGAAAGAALEGLAGLAGGHMFGLGPLGALLGAGIGASKGAYLGSKVPRFSGLPPSPGTAQNFLQSLGTRAGAAAGQKLAPGE